MEPFRATGAGGGNSSGVNVLSRLRLKALSCPPRISFMLDDFSVSSFNSFVKFWVVRSLFEFFVFISSSFLCSFFLADDEVKKEEMLLPLFFFGVFSVGVATGSNTGAKRDDAALGDEAREVVVENIFLDDGDDGNDDDLDVDLDENLVTAVDVSFGGSDEKDLLPALAPGEVLSFFQ